MSFYIIIRGPAGIGKTTVAKLLARRLHAFCISFDDIRTRHGIGLSEKQRIKANEVAIPIAKKKMLHGIPVIFDGVFYHSSQLKHLQKNLPYPGFVFSLSGSVNDVVARDTKRRGKAKLGRSKISNFYPVVAKFKPGTIIYTSGKTPKEIAEELLRKLNEASKTGLKLAKR